MTSNQFDVWDVETFDPALTARLEAHASLIREYMTADHQITLAHDLGRGPGRSLLRPQNLCIGFEAGPPLHDVTGANSGAAKVRRF